MKTKRITSILLTLCMLFSFVSVFAEGTTNDTTSVSITFAAQQDGAFGLFTPQRIEVADGIAEEYGYTVSTEATAPTVFDALVAVHEAKYGSAFTEETAKDYLDIKDGWITTAFSQPAGGTGFKVNSKTPADDNGTGYTADKAELKSGDIVEFWFYMDTDCWSDKYSTFDATEKTVKVGESFTLTLSTVGYDETATPVNGADENNYITVNTVNENDGSLSEALYDAEGTEITPDENGEISLSFDEVGTYIVTANGFITDEIIIDWQTYETAEIPCPITAPFCVVNVQPHLADVIIHNIAKKYVNSDLTQTSTNLPWIIADLMTYEKLYPNSENKLTDTQKQTYLDKLISDVQGTTSPNVLAKTIIALRSMGYDPRNVYTSSLEKIDVVGRLVDLVESEAASVVNNEYTLPYVMVALEQSEDYITEEQREYLIGKALSLSTNWQNVSWGTDALTPMLLALAPYYDNNADVKSKVDESVEILKGEQRDDGMIDAWPGSEGASTGLAICGLSALGINADKVKTENSENSLIDGMLTDVNDAKDEFSDAFSTEQGFRGLLAWRLITDGDGRDMYDFSDYPVVEAYATWASGCPVTFEVTPSDATVSVDGVEPVLSNMYDLAEGTYTYTVSKSGYNTKTEKIIVTSDDIENHTPKKVVVSLSGTSSESGSGSADTKISVSIRVMIHDDKCNGSYTYKYNSSKYTELVSETITAEKGVTVFDVLDEALTKNNIEYIEGSEDYISSIDGLAEFDHATNSGWMFTVDGKHVNVGCREKKLNSSSKIVWFYTDDYTQEQGSSNYSDGSSGSSTNKEDKTENHSFTDIADHWAFDAIEYVYNRSIMDGVSETEFAPDDTMTRAMLITVLYRLENITEQAKSHSFTDVKDGEWYADAVAWAAENGIVDGVTETEFAPNNSITREQMSAVLYRYAQYKDQDTSVGEDTNILSYTDALEISEYAIPAIQWMVGAGLMNGETDSTVNPKNNSTRAQVATILMRYLEQ